MLFINKLFNSIACLLSFTNLQLVIPGRTWILLYLGRTVYKRLWACLALYRVVLFSVLLQQLDCCIRSNLKSVPLPGGEAIGERGVLGFLPIPTPTLISLYPPSSFLQPPPCSPIPPPHKSLTLWEPLSIFFCEDQIY